MHLRELVCGWDEVGGRGVRAKGNLRVSPGACDVREDARTAPGVCCSITNEDAATARLAEENLVASTWLLASGDKAVVNPDAR